MVGEPRGTGGPPVVAFIGGGASATLTAVALLRTTTWLRLRYRLILFDEHGRHGPGAQYSCSDPGRRVEAPAKAMSALPDQPAHLVAWARRHSLPCDPDTRLPCGDYGEYLRETLAETATWAAPHVSLERRTARVCGVAGQGSAERRLRLRSTGAAGEEAQDAQAVVIATGPPRAGADPFLHGLVEQGLGRPGPRGAGLDTCPCGALVTSSGEVDHQLFAIGPVRRRRSAAAVPIELREQAERLGQLIADVVLRNRPTAPAAP